MRRAFTLTELLVSIGIALLLAATLTVAITGVLESARTDRAHSQLERINTVLLDRWQDYTSRQVNLEMSSSNPDMPVPTRPLTRVEMTIARLNALRAIQRLEMPDRITDMQPSSRLASQPSKWRAMDARVKTTWTPQYQSAECLYLIMSTSRIGDDPATHTFKDDEIGDLDGDGMPELLDPWKNPIHFIRWPVAFDSPLQDNDPATHHDPHDPFLVYPGWATYPMAYSIGPDGESNIDDAAGVSYQTLSPANNPYATSAGAVLDPLKVGHLDNINSHELGR